MPDFGSASSVQRYLAALEEQRKRKEEEAKARAAQFFQGFGGGPPIQGPQPRPVVARPSTTPRDEEYYTSVAPPTPAVIGPQQRPQPNPWQAAVDAWQAPPVQGPQADPWRAAVNAWQSGPPKPASSPQPFMYDVSAPTSPQVGLSFERPDTGPTGIDTATTFSPATINAPSVRPYGPVPEGENSWLTNQIGTWLGKPLDKAVTGANKFFADYGTDVMNVGPVDATLGLLEGTPGYDKLMLGAKERQEAGSNQGWDRFKDNFWNSMDALDALTARPIITQQIPGTGKLVGGENVSAGQLASAAGEMINKTLNPLNPNQVDMSYVELARDLFDGGPNAARQLFWDNLKQSQAVRTVIDALPPELRTQANVAMVNLISGPQAVQDTVNAILDQDDMVRDLEQKATQAQAEGNAQAAAQYGAQANELKNKTKTELIDEHANPWAEFMGGVFLDPTNYVSFGGKEALEAAKSSALMNLSPDEAIKALDGVLDAATKQAVGGNVATWWSKVDPFARTADTKAHLATDTLWRAATNLMSDVADKNTAKTILDLWTGDPRRLVEGVVLPGGADITKWGPGVVANSELLQQYPVLVKARDALLNMRSLAGDPATFSPTEFFAELNDVLYKQSRELFGLKQLDTLPAGATTFRVTRTATGTSVIEYLDKQNKVLKMSEETLPYNAELQAKQLKKAIASAGPGNQQNALQSFWGIQKGILSDMYLGQSPGYWIKNATSAATTLLADNTMTLLPTNQILNEFMTKFGQAPTTRSAEAAGSALGQAAGEVLGGMHWSEKLFGKDNPYAKLMGRLYQIPFGATDIAGRVPFGEQNFALRATYVPFKRYLTSQWTDAARGFEQTLAGLGIDPSLAKSLASTVAEVGINGNKQQLQNAVRKLTTSATVPYSLKELGVPDELLSAEGWAKLNNIFTEALPTSLDEAVANVRQVFGNELKQAGQLLTSAPPQPGRQVWTQFDAVQDGADVVDTMVDAAKRAGLPADTMRQEAAALMKQIADAENGLWATLRGELAGNDNPAALNVAMDLLAQWYDWRAAARSQVDELGRQAVKTNTADAWAKKFEGTKQIYGGFTQWFQGAVDNARQSLLKVEGGQPVEGGYDWWSVIKRYADYDEADVRAARTGGLGVGSPQTPGDAFTKALDANRKYVDKSVVELFSAFKRYASQENLDLMADGIRKMEDLGSRAAAFLADKRSTMLPKQADAYYKLRNQVWAEFFDNAVIHNNAVKRLLVANGVADMAKGALRWTDDFAGGEFQLIGKLADGYWQVRNVATGELDRFADPVALAQKRKAGEAIVSSLVEVPLKVVQDFYRVIGENNSIVDALVKEIDDAGAAKWAAQEAEAMALLDQPVTVPSMRLIAPAADVAAQQAEAAGRAADLAAGSKEARATLRTEWDRIAEAENGYAGIDQLIAAHTRNGVVNVPENKFADLYGKTIAGRRIENQDDVNRLLQEYYNLSQQAKQASNFVPTPLTTDLGMGGGQLIGALIDQLQKARAANPYALAPGASGWNPFGLVDGRPTDLYKLISGINNNLMTLMGKKAPEMGEVAQHTIRTLADAERRILQRLPEILQGRPNTLTPAQQLRVIDVVQEMLPQYDNVLAGAVRTGEQMANYAMLNYNDKRNLDVWLGALMPYHYFWSRSAKNWLQRAAQKPGIVNMWYESQRAIERENQQNNIPQHLQGTIQNPLAQLGVGPDRLMNPLNFMLPFAMYLGSDFVNPDDAKSEFERWKLTVQKYTPAMFPLAEYAARAILDKTNPLPGDKRRVDEFQLGDVLPLYKLVGYGYQAATGDMSWSQGPLGYGDEYDYGRAGKQVALASLRGDITPTDAKWGLDVGYQQANQVGPLPEQQGQGVNAWLQGAQAAGWDRLMNRAGAFLTGIPGYSYSPEEKQMREMKAERATLGYDQLANPWGSQAAVSSFDESTGGILGPTYAYGQLYPQEQKPPAPNAPGYQQNFEQKRPGVSAVDEAKKEEKAAIYAAMNEAVDSFIAENPNAKNKELYAIKQPFYDQVKALDEKYPSATVYDNPFPVSFNTAPGVNPTSGPQLPDYYGNMNPAELQEAATENALRQAQAELADMKPSAPGEGATPAQWQQYYADKEAYEKAVAGRIDEITSDPNLMAQLVAGRTITPTVYPDGTTSELPAVSPGTDVLAADKVANMTESEQALRERNAEKQAAKSAEIEQNRQGFADRRTGVVAEFGEDAGATWDAYYALPKGDARSQYADANPEIKLYNLAAYNPTEFAQAKELFGQEALLAWVNTPAYADTPEAKAARAAYLDANPQATVVNAWMWGRPGANNTTYNFGADYQAAQEQFGPDIWTTVSQYKRGWNKTQKRAFYQEHPEYEAWSVWWYGSTDTQTATGSSSGRSATRGTAGSSTGGGGGGGYGGGYGSYTPKEREQKGFNPAYAQPYVKADEMDNYLMPREQYINKWRPADANTAWLNAGAMLRPGQLSKWTPGSKK